MLNPIEVRFTRKGAAGAAHYAGLIVWPGVGNTSHMRHKFATRRDAKDYASREWPGVPVIFD